MKKKKLKFSIAFNVVLSGRSFICPNRGFKSQLEIYEKLNFSIKNDHQEYIRHKKEKEKARGN